MTEPKPWLIDEAGAEARRHAPATLRNRDAICDILRAYLPPAGTMLEIASGSGEHIVHFAKAMPGLTWQPSDREPAALQSIAAWSERATLPNIRSPLLIDVEQPDWPVSHADAILCINMVHISPWSASEALFRNAARLLRPTALLYLYGPFIRHDVTTASSNLAFDASLQERNPQWGLRRVAAIDALAQKYGFASDGLIEMPANNLSLIYRRI